MSWQTYSVPVAWSARAHVRVRATSPTHAMALADDILAGVIEPPDPRFEEDYTLPELDVEVGVGVPE